MSINAAYITPHPPLIFPEIGGGEEKTIQSTINSMHTMANRITSIKPEIIVIITPHSIMYSDYIHISPGSSARGDMSDYRASQVEIHVDYDEDFVSQLEITCEQNGISAGTLGEKNSTLDHGTIIPLRFINEKYTSYKTIRIAPAGIGFDELYSFGKILKDVSENLNKKTVVIASGDLSHKLKSTGPYGYAKEGPKFDHIITDAIDAGDFSKFMEIDRSLEEKAAECGLRGFIIMAGTLDKTAVKATLMSYEGPFGVGYAVGEFIPDGKDPKRDFLKSYRNHVSEKVKEERTKEDSYVKLARNTVEELTINHREYKPDYQLPDEMIKNSSGVFVSIKKNGELRGCIGTTSPLCENIAREIIRNAISASSEDPRFPPVTKEELNKLSYSVDILKEPEDIDDDSQLDTDRYGVIVKLGSKRGLLLPNLDGVDTVDDQIKIAMQKAGIPSTERDRIELQRFEVIRHY